MIFERDERATLMNVHIVTFVDVGDIFNSPMGELDSSVLEFRAYVF